MDRVQGLCPPHLCCWVYFKRGSHFRGAISVVRPVTQSAVGTLHLFFQTVCTRCICSSPGESPPSTPLVSLTRIPQLLLPFEWPHLILPVVEPSAFALLRTSMPFVAGMERRDFAQFSDTFYSGQPTWHIIDLGSPASPAPPPSRLLQFPWLQAAEISSLEFQKKQLLDGFQAFIRDTGFSPNIGNA